MTRIAMLGAGSWGSTFSLVLGDAGCDVAVWARREEIARAIREDHRNPEYLGDVVLPASVTATANVAEALDGVDGVVLALPTQRLRDNLIGWKQEGITLPKVPVLSLAKGIERGTDQRMSQVIAEAGEVDPALIAVLSGPNLAVEIAARQPSGSVIAAADEALAHEVARWCAAPGFRSYVSQDVVGVEIAGAMKNVIAIAVGAAVGLGYGTNTCSTLITRGLAEITRLGVALGGQPATFAGLAGMGDLVATCTSPLSRNHRLGHALGRGLDVEAALLEVGQTAEGVATARAVDELAQRLDIDMPITKTLVGVVDHGVTIEEATAYLLARSVRPE